MITPKLQLLRKVCLRILIAHALLLTLSLFFSFQWRFGRTSQWGLAFYSWPGMAAVELRTATGQRTPPDPDAGSWFSNSRIRFVDESSILYLPTTQQPLASSPYYHTQNYGPFQIVAVTKPGLTPFTAFVLYYPFILISGAAFIGFTLINLFLPYIGKYADPGHCVYCRYDLSASPQRCPECGALTPVVWIEPDITFLEPARHRRRRWMCWVVIVGPIFLVSISLMRFAILYLSFQGMPASWHWWNTTIIQLFAFNILMFALAPVLLVRAVRRRPHIILDRAFVQLDRLNNRLRWRRIKNIQILLAPPCLPILQVTTSRRTLTRAIAPEINVDELRQRLQAWTAKPPSGPGVTLPVAAARGNKS